MRLLTHMGVGCLSLMMCFSSFSDLSAHSSSGGHKHKHKHKHHKSSQCEIYCPPPVVVAPSFGNFYTTALSAVTSGSAVVFNASQSNSPDITLNIDEDVTIEFFGMPPDGIAHAFCAIETLWRCHDNFCPKARCMVINTLVVGCDEKMIEQPAFFGLHVCSLQESCTKDGDQWFAWEAGTLIS